MVSSGDETHFMNLAKIDQIPIREYRSNVVMSPRALIILQNLGWKRNMESVLGKRSLYWCWPTVPPGSGLKYPLAAGQGKWIELNRSDRKGYGDHVFEHDELPEP